MGSDHWPLFGLEVRTERVILRYPDDALVAELMRVATSGVHPPDFMPFLTPWTRFESPVLEQRGFRFHWRCRADTEPNSFRIPLAVIADGEVIGASEIEAQNFAALRVFGTGSWLGQQFQGRGFGKALRLATLALGFDGLGAERATTGAWADNAASLGVTRSLGYTAQGRVRQLREGTPTDELRFDMERSHFETIRPAQVQFVGLDPVLEFLELSGT